MPRKLPAHVQAAFDEARRRDEERLPRAPRVELSLPFPPSVNNLYRSFTLPNGRVGRAKSKRGQDYDRIVSDALAFWKATTGRRPPAPPYRLTLTVYPPGDGRRHDLSNCFKAPEDSLFAAIGEDDNDVHVWHGEKGAPEGRGRVELVLEGSI